ncbi:heme exporter protein CcmD [Larsenimonas salina]|uniref:heme exporter protein CcmD n=1 Tax=Larsenimonas salina TaxID=1295565 RepID=UPI002072F9A8|nr:heme exporter protein CcmD [Larsenimonas salina]
MAFQTLNEFLSMNGYGVYVWSAWAVVVGAWGVQAGWVHLEYRRVRAGILRQIRREARS